MHYVRFKTHGDPLIKFIPGAVSDDDVTYHGVHSRLSAKLGRAAGQSCSDCGQQAAQWSYDHTDPSEKRSKFGPYSADLGCYTPRCVPCHKQFDLTRLRNERWLEGRIA